jgi:hypothetical protein
MEVLYKDYSFRPYQLTNMAATGKSCCLLELPVAAMFVNGSEQHKQSQQRTFHRCFLSSFGTFGQTVSEQKNF